MSIPEVAVFELISALSEVCKADCSLVLVLNCHGIYTKLWFGTTLNFEDFQLNPYVIDLNSGSLTWE
ncbi:hypothetical protein SLEP1_g38677 [Rubroshorea leprosula]|uniref:DUF2442 domain-containing protein n=1 Tax=Rubroshorea leprosula TaxID=152421 RepID=A0AAV5KY41_9ROSI|nr:hypothetical protein SLEP1_g38677 [Rubroshorea leprosula]